MSKQMIIVGGIIFIIALTFFYPQSDSLNEQTNIESRLDESMKERQKKLKPPNLDRATNRAQLGAQLKRLTTARNQLTDESNTYTKYFNNHLETIETVIRGLQGAIRTKTRVSGPVVSAK